MKSEFLVIQILFRGFLNIYLRFGAIRLCPCGLDIVPRVEFKIQCQFRAGQSSKKREGYQNGIYISNEINCIEKVY